MQPIARFAALIAIGSGTTVFAIDRGREPLTCLPFMFQVE